MTKTRNEKLLQHIDPAKQVGVEIGSLTSPIVTRDMGLIYYIDHATTEALKAKYANDANVDISKIVSVDYVWGEKSLAELTQAKQPFDYLIASHVIEHVPDLIGWLNEIRTILKPGGILSLAIPDKRQCFDYKRQTSRLGDVFEAYLHRSKRPTPRQIFDHVASAVRLQEGYTWSANVEDAVKLTHYHSLADAQRAAKDAFESDAYCDVHCWVFTPRSFFKLLEELAKIDLLRFEVVQFHETVGCEFFVSLRAVDHPTYPFLMQTEPDEDEQLQPKTIEEANQLLRERLKEKERAVNDMQAHVQAMESSKFWKMRMAWFKIKQKLGLPTH